MEKTRRNTTKIALAIVAILLVSSALAVFSNSANTEVAATDNEDLLQYDWPRGGADEGNTGFNSGPAPDRPSVLWRVSTPGSGMVSVFDGKAFVIQGTVIAGTVGTALHAFDAFTGQKLWTSQASGISFSGVSGVDKLDDTYLLGEATTAFAVIRISDGAVMWNKTVPNGSGHPGSGSYFAGHYSDGTKMLFEPAWDAAKYQAQILAYNLSDPSKEAPLQWTYVADTPSEILCSGGGKLFLGTTEATVYAVDIATGQRVWQTHTEGGLVQQNAMYYNGKFYTSAVSTQMTCFDAETGDIVWQYEKGPRTFSAYRGAAAYGLIFDATVEVDPHGYVRAWDAETGKLIWRQPAYYNIKYSTLAVADGKVYSTTCDQAAGSATAGLVMPGYETTCFDAYTGTVLYKLYGINFATPSIAYGNLYGLYGGYLHCIGGPAKDWNFGFVGNVATPRVAIGQPGPADISTPKWTFKTGGDISSSPAVVNGKVYFGSHDKNWYCLDARTGSKIWNFTVGFYVRSSAAVVSGRVFTGADDGYFYALDAETGQKIWQTSAGGFIPNVMVPTEFNPRSSPIVVGNRIFVGSLDGSVYCLDTANGNTVWKRATGGPVIGSPAYSDGTVYITSTDTYLYALDAATGNVKWKSMPLNLDIVAPPRSNTYNIGTPTVAGGLVIVGGGVQYGTAITGFNYYPHSVPSGAWGGTIRYMAFNATTGASFWNLTRAGNTQPGHVPTYFNGQVYAGEFFVITSMNATNPNSGPYAVPDFGAFMGARRPGNRTWGQWLGYQISSSVAYADDITGAKVYVGCDIGSVYALNASSGATLSVFTTKGNVPSSPAIWEGKVYVGSTDGNMYCFDDAPVLSTSICAASNKGSVMWNNETIIVEGQLLGNPDEMTWDQLSKKYVPIASDMHPGIPNATVILSFTKPDMSSVNVTTATDKHGNFQLSYNPNVVGDWGWVAYYEGKVMPNLAYDCAYSEWNQFEVTAAPTSDGTSPTPPPPPPAEGTPVEYIYVVVAVIAIALIAIGAYAYTRRGKK